MKEFQEQLLKRLDRVADTFDRLATVLTLESGTLPDGKPIVPAAAAAAPVDLNGFKEQLNDGIQPGFTFAESGEEYQQRQSRDAAFAISLGVAPWSRDFQTTITQMKYDYMRPHMENRQDGQGNWSAVEVEGYSEEKAEQIVADAFRLARAEANVRQGAAV